VVSSVTYYTSQTGTFFPYNQALIENVVTSPNTEEIYLNTLQNTVSGYNPAGANGDDRIIEASSADRIDLSNFSRSSVSQTRTGGDLVLGLGTGIGSITIVGYYTGSTPTVAFSGEVATPTPTATVVATGTPVATATPSPTATRTPLPTATATSTATATVTVVFTATATAAPTNTATPEPTRTATPSPTSSPLPTQVPTQVPTVAPTATVIAPTPTATVAPTKTPSKKRKVSVANLAINQTGKLIGVNAIIVDEAGIAVPRVRVTGVWTDGVRPVLQSAMSQRSGAVRFVRSVPQSRISAVKFRVIAITGPDVDFDPASTETRRFTVRR
jgi:hypothetical protein